MQVPKDMQLKTNGYAVNVPAHVINVVNLLPRLPTRAKWHLKSSAEL